MNQTATRLSTAAASLVIVIATTLILIYTKTVMIPFVLAVFLAFTVGPIVDFLQVKCKLPRALAVIGTALAIVLFLGLITLLVTSSVKQLMQNIDVYKANVAGLVAQIIKLLHKLEIAEFDKEHLLETVRSLPLFSYVRAAAQATLGFASDTLLVVLFVVFMLSGQAPKFSSGGIASEIDKKIRAYLVTKVLTSACTGILTAIILGIIGVDMAMMFGVLAFILNFIPTVGSLVAMLLPIPVVLFEFGLGWQLGLAVGLPGAIQFVIGNVIEPKYMGDSLDLHPVTILLSLMFWGLIWGVPGMILATPFTVIIKLALDRIPGGEFFARLMAGELRA